MNKWIPSRNWSIFLGSVVSLSSYAAYDKYQLRLIRKELCDQVAAIAAEPMAPNEMPRKVWVYTAPTQWATYWFREYVKPVFDAAAMDYELISTKELQDIRAHARDKLWDAKQGWIPRGHPARRSYWQWILGAPKSTLPTGDPSNPDYHPEQGWLALGPEAWEELVQGIQDGALGNASLLQTREVEVPDEGTPVLQTFLPKESLSLDHLPPTFPLPILGFLPGREQTGWKSFPKRIFGYFHQRWTAREVGDVAVKVAFGKVQTAQEDAFVYPRDEITLGTLDQPLIKRLSYYI